MFQPITIPELKNYKYVVLSYFDFIEDGARQKALVNAVFHVLPENFPVGSKGGYSDCLKKSTSKLEFKVPLTDFASISVGSVFYYGDSLDLDRSWYSEIVLKDCRFADSVKMKLSEYYNREFGGKDLRFLADNYKDSNILVFSRPVEKSESDFISRDIILPCSLVFLRFSGISSYSIESIIEQGLPSDTSNPIYYDISDPENETEIIIYLKKSVPNAHAAYWANCIYYPSIRETINDFKLKKNLALFNNAKAKIAFELEWPLFEDLKEIVFYGRETYINGKIYFIVSRIGYMVTAFSESGIKVTHNRENDGRKKADKKDAVIKKPGTLTTNTGDGVGGSEESTGDQHHTNTVPTTNLEDWLRFLPEKNVLEVEKQKWISQGNPKIKEFNNSGLGDHNSDSDNSGYNENADEDNEYYSRFPDVVNSIKEKYPDVVNTQYKFLKGTMDADDRYTRFKDYYAANHELDDSNRSPDAAVHFCFKPINPNKKLKHKKRRRRYYIMEVKIDNLSYHVLELEPRRGSSCCCYIFQGKSIEDIHNFVTLFAKVLGNEAALKGKGFMCRIKHPTQFLKDEKEYIKRLSERIISKIT